MGEGFGGNRWRARTDAKERKIGVNKRVVSECSIGIVT